MAQNPISNLPFAEGLDGSESVPIVQGPRTKQATVDQMRGITDIVPDDSDDPRGLPGNVSFTDDYMYVRLEIGWRRLALETF